MASVHLGRGRDKRVRAGHPWIYAGEIAEIVGRPEGGDIVDVLDAAGSFLGRGYINPFSQITVRMLTRRDEKIDGDFFRRALRRALEYRGVVAKGVSSCRLVFGEGDGLPGLIIDKYEDALSVQTLSLGMDRRKTLIVEIALELTGLEKAYERNDVRSRELEGLKMNTGYLTKEFSPVYDIVENGFRFEVDIARGQKTGYFLDHRENRAAIAPYVFGARVLDAFCYIGTFAVHAAGYGAREVLGVDISPQGVEAARTSARANGVADVCRFTVGNAFDQLRALESLGDEFDVVILDPPAFTKNRATVEAAARGYKEINLRGCKLLKEGGFLITSSCSHHIDESQFMEIVSSALKDAGRTGRLVEVRSQSKDHPILLSVPETKYLKCLILQVL